MLGLLLDNLFIGYLSLGLFIYFCFCLLWEWVVVPSFAEVVPGWLRMHPWPTQASGERGHGPLFAWISNYTQYKVCDEITYPFPNFNGSLGMDKWFHPTFCWTRDYLSVLGLKLILISKRGPRCCALHGIYHICVSNYRPLYMYIFVFDYQKPHYISWFHDIWFFAFNSKMTPECWSKWDPWHG